MAWDYCSPPFFWHLFAVMRVEASTLSQLFGDDYAPVRSGCSLFIRESLHIGNPKTAGVKFDPGLYLRYANTRQADSH